MSIHNRRVHEIKFVLLLVSVYCGLKLFVPGIVSVLSTSVLTAFPNTYFNERRYVVTKGLKSLKEESQCVERRPNNPEELVQIVRKKCHRYILGVDLMPR